MVETSSYATNRKPPLTMAETTLFLPGVSPCRRRAIRGMIHCAAVDARSYQCNPVLSGCRDSERAEHALSRYIFGSLLKPIDRRRFQTFVEKGDAYYKSFMSWDYLVTLIFA
jgi:hypothetical protein